MVDGDRAESPPGSAAATQEQELRHELRTPLNAIKGYSEMLREDVAIFSGDSLRADIDRLLVAATDLLLGLDRVVQFSVDVDETSLASDQTGAVIVSDLMRSLGPVRHAPNAITETGSILVVDDIEANRDLLSRRLTRDGHRVGLVAGGQQALQALADDEFDLVLLDLMMPDINGFDVLVRMKADERLRRIPVIMITALTETESAVRCIEAGPRIICRSRSIRSCCARGSVLACTRSAGATASRSIFAASRTRPPSSSGCCSPSCQDRLSAA